MKYKLYFNVIMCDRFCSNFIKGCDLGIEEYGVTGTVSFITETEPTNEYVEKMIKILEKTKEEKTLEKYFVNVKLDRIEIVEKEEIEKEKIKKRRR